MSLKEQLNSYTEQPDAELYSRIEKSLRRRRMARRAAVIVPAAAALVAAVVLLRPAPQPELAQAALPQAVAPAPAEATPEVVAPEAVPVTAAETRPASSPRPATVETRPASSPQPAAPQQQMGQMAALPAAVETRPASSPRPAAVETRPAASHTQQPVAAATVQAPSLQEAQPAVGQPEAQPAVVQQQPTKAPVVVDPEEVPEFYIPNAFAPEGDDPAVRTFHFTLRPGYTVDNFKLYIFNRGGRQVFYSTDINRCWDGTFKGAVQPMGNYVYKMQYRDAEGNLKVVAGNVTLIRK